MPSPATRLRALAGSALGATLLVAALPAVAPSAAAAGPETVRITGKGWGHAKGLSQYGALRRAQAGQSAAQILDAYYPGTATGQASGAIRVLVTADTTTNVVVQARPRLKVRSVATGRTWRLTTANARRWKLTPAGTRATRLSVRLPGGWRFVREIPGEAEFKAPGGVRLHVPGGSAVYRGKVRSAVPTVGTGRDTVNVLNLDKYLRGVVPREVPATWHPSAVQAQAVAARTYAVFEREATRRLARSYFDVWDTTRSQVYDGVTAEHPSSDAAIRATAGLVRTWEGAPAFTQFSSSNGGYSAAGSQPYLVAQPDSFDPASAWEVSLTDDRVERAHPGIGDLRAVEVTGTGAGDRVTQVTLHGAKADKVLSGDEFRTAFGLRSTLFVVAG